MLVLTRKEKEQILIGDNIKLTLVRVRGNSVRVGIEAPRDVRVVRGELTNFDSNPADDAPAELDDPQEVFAHPQPAPIGRHHPKPAIQLLVSDAEDDGPVQRSERPKVFMGRVRCAGDGAKLRRAPLAGFVSAN